MTAHFIFKLLSFLLFLAPSAACFQSERAALWDLKSGLDDPGYSLWSWTGRDCCSWAGVRCDNRTGHVVRLDLRNPIPYGSGSMALFGNLTRSLVALTHLNYLDLSNNYFLEAPLPRFLASLGELHYLNLSSAGFSGPIPLQFGNISGLRTLDLSYIYFSDDAYGNLQLVRALGALDSLDTLSLAGCGLSSIPQSLPKGSFKSLTSLDLSYNQFNSTIPALLFNITSLEYLNMAYNSMTGVLSEWHLASMSSLKSLDLSGNALVINVSEDWFPSFQLEYLALSSCPLGPRFPRWIRNQTNFETLDFSNAGIEDAMPDWFWNLTSRLEYLDISNNRITGRLPTSLIMANGFVEIRLNSNLFQGSVPNVSSLWYLDLSNNSLSGSIPPHICELVELRGLDLSNNHLSGELPDCWNNQSSHMKFINVASNDLSGTIPSSIGLLPYLEAIHLSDNGFTGEIPSSLKNCTGLGLLDLSYNELVGNIPTWIGEMYLEILSLRSNKLTGDIPPQLAQLQSLQVLDLSHNNLSGGIPWNFGNFSAMKTVQTSLEPLYWSFYTLDTGSFRINDSMLLFVKGSQLRYKGVPSIMDLSDNDLSGNIPVELFDLAGLYSLDLSKNHLSGVIHDSIGNLRQLEALDLSRNQLSGKIPQSLAALAWLSFLNLSYNSLEGRIPTGSQLQTLTDQSIYIGNRDLCGFPLPRKCESSSDHDRGYSTSTISAPGGDDVDWKWALAGAAPGLAVGITIGWWVLLVRDEWRGALFRRVDRVYDTTAAKVFGIRSKRKHNRRRHNRRSR